MGNPILVRKFWVKSKASRFLEEEEGLRARSERVASSDQRAQWSHPISTAGLVECWPTRCVRCATAWRARANRMLPLAGFKLKLSVTFERFLAYWCPPNSYQFIRRSPLIAAWLELYTQMMPGNAYSGFTIAIQILEIQAACTMCSAHVEFAPYYSNRIPESFSRFILV